MTIFFITGPLLWAAVSVCIKHVFFDRISSLADVRVLYQVSTLPL